MDTEDAKKIVEGVSFIDMIRGSYQLSCLESESSARQNARRSLVAACDIPRGSVITREMITFKRPGGGLSPVYLDDIIGKKAAVDIEDDTILQRNMFIWLGEDYVKILPLSLSFKSEPKQT